MRSPPNPQPLSFLCFGDLPWPWTARIVQCRSVAVTHVMCWRGLRRKRRRQGSVILVCSPVEVRVRLCVKGWACLAQNTDCTSSTNLSTKTPFGLLTSGGGVETSTRACCDVEEQHDGFKAALKFLGCREGRLHGGRTRERVKWNLSPDSPLVKPTWLKQSSFSFCLVGNHVAPMLHSVGHKLQKNRCYS